MGIWRMKKNELTNGKVEENISRVKLSRNPSYKIFVRSKKEITRSDKKIY